MTIAITVALLYLVRFLESDISAGSSSPGIGLSSSFIREWPAISEDEFMSRCPDGTDREIALKTRRIVAEQLGIPYEHVYPEQNFVKDLGCD